MKARIDALCQRLPEIPLDAFIVTSPPSLRYLFGFTGSSGLGLLTAERSIFVTDLRYRDQARQEVTEVEIIVTRKELLGVLQSQSLLHGHERLGFEAAHVTVAQYHRLRKLFPEMKLIAVEGFVEKLTRRKAPEEIECIRRGAQWCSRVFQEVLPLIKPGVSELDIAAELSYRIKRRGGDGDSFEPIVASGPRSALPHGVSSRRLLREGEWVVIDFGCTVEGYASDLARTVVVGEPTPKQREVYEVVREANARAIASARAGLPAPRLDAVARQFIQAKGYGDYFTHSLGHGLGLHLHEGPKVGPESKDVLEVGNVITIEPGIYLPGFGGVRIEDDVVLTANGCEVLTDAPRELLSVG